MACFDENTLIDMARGRVGAAGLAELERHLASCDECAGAVAAAAQTMAPAGAVTLAGSSAGQASAPGALAPGTVLKQRYRIVRQIGRGGMGEVYEAAHTRLSGRYAIKVLGPDVAGDAAVLSRFKREAEITSALAHPNIVQVFDFDETPEGRPFLAMEYLEGRHLGEVIRAEGAMPLERVLALVTPVVSALSAVHGQDIVHRDLKPQNIMLVVQPGDGAEMVKLLDFGLSKRGPAGDADSLLVSGGQLLLGTPMYMAPEQALGEAVKPTADQFSLGAIVYQMLAGTAPFEAESIPKVLGRVIYADPPPLRTLLPDLPAGAEAAVARAIEKVPEQRFPTLKAFLEALREPEAPVTRAAPPTPPRVSRRWASAAAAVASLAVLGGVAVWRLSSSSVTIAAPAPSRAPAVAPPPAIPASFPVAAIVLPASPAAAAPARPARPTRHRPHPRPQAPEPAPVATPKPAPPPPSVDLFDHP